MRILGAAVLLLLATLEGPKPMSIAIEPLGDGEDAVVARVFFRFANARDHRDRPLPRRRQERQVPVAPHGRAQRNGSPLRRGRGGDRSTKPPALIAEATEKFTLTKTNRPLPAEEEEPRTVGPVSIAPPRKNPESNLHAIKVDAIPSVKRVELRVNDKKILTRNTPPFTTELDLGDAPAVVHAIGYDAAGRVVDADAFVVNESEQRISVKLTRVATADGRTHFKLTHPQPPAHAPDPRRALRRRPEAARVGQAAVHALPPHGEPRRRHRIRASVVDDAGEEASDR